MRAWLVTWYWGNDAAELADSIAAVLSARWSEKRVADIVEQLYALHTSNVRELAAYARYPARNMYRAKSESGQLTCGANPWLNARLVDEFSVAVNPAGHEVVSWREPDRWSMKSDESGTEVKHIGVHQRITRIVCGPLSQERVWDDEAKRRNAKFAAPAD